MAQVDPSTATNAQPPNPVVLDEAQKRTLREFIQALEELEDCFIEAARETALPLSQSVISESDVRLLEATRRAHQDGNYEASLMLQYLETLPDFKQQWRTLTRGLLIAFGRTPEQDRSPWRFRL